MAENGSFRPDSEEPPAAAAAAAAPVAAPVQWRLALLVALAAGISFFLLILLASAVPAIIWPASLLFLPGGLFLGRRSRRPWAEGAIYGLTGAASALLALAGYGFLLGSLFALILVLPQALLGTWLGARLWPARPRR